ncbi:MAG: AhpC/TSA family protein [Hyphomonas sp.]|jgi:peroxiredoxin|nr:AhpC/TSA family protein [Hyphomonas sp.]
MSLSSRLLELRAELGGELPSGALERLSAASAGLHASGAFSAMLCAGDPAPNFQLRDNQGKTVSLNSLLGRGSVVVCFYVGEWCPFCREQLAALGDVASEFDALGASVIAVAPQCGESSAAARVVDRKFPRLQDPSGRVARKFGLAYSADPGLHDDYSALGRPEGCDAPLLVPATYIVEPSGRIVFSHSNTDFTARAEPEEILVVLRGRRAWRMRFGG